MPIEIQQTSENSPLLPLPDESDITKARKIGDGKIKGFSDEEIKQIRIQCKWDLLFLMDGPLGYSNVSPVLHGHLAKWLQRNRYIQYKLLLLPRGHYKSTEETISGTVQDVLPDDTGTAQYPFNLSTNIRICIAHDVAEMAQKFLRSITQHFTINPFLIALFPECIPDLKKNRVNIKELELPRSAVWNESTIDTMGVGARGQGNHYNKLRLDDIYGEAARDSKTEREAHIQWFDNIQSFLITPKTDFIQITGTRWAFDDVYAHAMKVYGKELLKYIRSVYEKDEKGILQPIFPEQFSIASLEILKKNKKVWNAQYINDPKEGAASFQPEWKRFYNKIGRRDLQVFNQSSPFAQGGSEEISFEELDRIILIDPAIEGLTGITVVGTDFKDRHFILDAIKGSIKPEELCNWVFTNVIKYQPRLVAIESVLFSALYEHWFRTEMQVRGIRFRIEPIKIGNKQKEIRVAGLANYFQANTIFFHESQTELIEEYDQFGATDDYHMLDSLSMGPGIWKKGNRVSNVSQKDEELREKVREISTGYSKIRG